MSGSESEGEGGRDGTGDEDLPRGKLLPLNSRRLTAAHLKSIADSLGLPTTGSTDQIRQLIEGKLQEEHEVSNVQVVVQETSTVSVQLSLVDEDGVFHSTTPYQKGAGESLGRDQLELKLAESVRKSEELETELLQNREQLKQDKETIAQLTEQLLAATTESSTEEIEVLRAELNKEKAKAKRMWKLNCEQAAEQENLLAEKDEEIAELKRKLTEHRSRSPSRSTFSELDDALPHRPTVDRATKRRGKAPPVDYFTGEDPELRFEDWLPALERAAHWNEWRDEERVIQLAGHLRGHALQEWNLLEEEEKENYDSAIKALRDVLGPGSKVLAAQDFRHTTQEDGESVAVFVRRLERTFRIAYGGDKLSSETRGAFLYGQLQEGLRQGLMQSPNVSGALTYKELVMAAKNEERRQAELKKRKQYLGTPKASASATPAARKYQVDTDPRPYRPDRSNKFCDICRKVGHQKSECRRRHTKSESTGSGAFNRQSPKPNHKVSTKQVKIESLPSEALEDPVDYLYSTESDEEQDIRLVRVDDKGSSPQCARVLVQGVPADGIVDSGAEITIMGPELFKKVASVCRLRKKEFKKPDQIPRTYDQKVFSLDGKLTLDITFGETTMSTSVYVKMDTCDQLLLAEGVCRQLGIISYHPDVRPWNKDNGELVLQPSDKQKESTLSKKDARVPQVRVRLLQSVKVLPQHTKNVKVQVDKEYRSGEPMLLEPDSLLDEKGLQIDRAIFRPDNSGIGVIRLTNPTGYSCKVTEGLNVGVAEEITLVSPRLEDRSSQAAAQMFTPGAIVKRVASGSEKWRRDEMLKIYRDSLDLPSAERDTFCQFLMDHHQAFSMEEGERGETDLVEMEIDTEGSSPKSQRPRRMPFAVRQEISRQLKMMQAAGVVQPSKSPWASPVVLVRKKDGSHRFCVDYRELNSVTKADNFPLPRIEDNLERLGRSRYFSTLDLSAGYWQIRMKADSREKTAFTTPHGLFEFLVMPFGLTNAPAVFQRLMHQVLLGLNPDDGADFVSVYIDDILVFSETLEDHVKHLATVMNRLIEVGLKLKPTKCHFCRQEVEYLGHVITPHGLKTSEKHIAAVREFPIPETVRDVRRFLGMASYYRRFIPQFAKIAQPLHALTKKDIVFKWTQQCQEAMDILKLKLISAPVLAYPDFERPFILETDASIQGLGVVLSQVREDGRSHPVAYASRALSPSEKNYGITDLETLAVVWSVGHFQSYLYGHDVTIYTDHSAVKAVLTNPQSSGKHARWWIKVHASGIKSVNVVYRPGKENANADALSRAPAVPVKQEDKMTVPAQVSLIATDSIQDLLQVVPDATSLANPSTFAIEQRKDKQLTAVIRFLKDGTLPEDKQARKLTTKAGQFTIRGDVLYYLDPKHQGRRRAVVPCHLRNKIMEETHSGVFAGHFSSQRLYNTLARVWWWDGMYCDAVRHVKKCPNCAIVTGGGRVVNPPLQPIPVRRVFQIVGVDVMDLPKTDQGNKHVLVFQDFLSKWPMVFPIPDQKSERIVKILVEEIVPLFGVPEALLSDRGTNLLSNLMKETCSLLGIEKLNTTAYHPQCDGLTERFNRTLKTMIRKHAATYGSQWDKYLHGLLWAYRNTPHESTGEKPSFLLYGMDCRTPTEAVFLPTSELEPTTVSTYREELVKTLTTARELAASSNRASQAKYKKQHDKKTKPLPYRAGEWILIRFPQEETGAKRKLSRPWHGPYRVVSTTNTGVTALKVYYPQDGTIQVHSHRVTKCPDEFPPGYFWYGSRRKGPGRPPKWVDDLMSNDEKCVDVETDMEGTDIDPEPVTTDSISSDDEISPPLQSTQVQRKTRTRTVVPPNRFATTLGSS